MGAEFGLEENDFSKSHLNAPAKGSESAEVIHPEKGMWKSRTPLDKHILAIIVLLCLVTAVVLSAIILLVVLDIDKSMATENGTSIHNGPQNFDGSGDSSKDSSLGRPTKNPRFKEIAAAYILEAMNTSVNPCENFFEFACGQWIHRHPIPDDMSGFSTLAYVREQAGQQLRVLLEEDVVSESKSVNVVRAMYRICMNEAQIEELKALPLLEALTKLGEWPLLQEKWDKTKFNFKNLLFGYSAFFSIFVSVDSRNSSRHTLFIDQSNLALVTLDYYLNTTRFSNQMAAYQNYLRDIAQLLKTDGNFTRSEADMNVDIDKIIAFETEIANIMVVEEISDYNKREIRDLYSLFPQINWVPFIQSIAPADMAHLFHNGTEIIINAIEYIRHISDLIQKTDARILTDYVVWRIVQSSVEYLDKRFNDISKGFSKVMTGRKQSPPRWKICTKFSSTALPLAVGVIYVQAHFQKSDKEEASRMTTNLIKAFVDMVKTNEWMDEVTKAAAIEKANSMIKYIGYPNIINDLPQLDKHYSGLSINESDTYYCIMRKIGVWVRNIEFQQLTKPFDKHHFETSPAIVNAVYFFEKNAIVFPAAILQPPIFSGSFPKAVNYGAIGAIIGHEITHGFDDEGSQYDKDGNVRNWWSNSSLNEFDIRRRCIVEQYGSYTVPKTNYRVNGILTQGENIADNGGVKEAFKAYQKYVQENGEEPRLPGLQQYTNEQIFFLSYAQTSCEKRTEAATIQKVLTDEHSPNVFRVNGVLSNMEEFANTFNCPPNSPLNPNHKCSVW